MSTRDPVEALRERTALLEEELRGLDQKQRERAAVESQVTRVEAELSESRALLDRLQKKRALPMLDRMSIASPCSANWSDMVGDEKSRYCGKCEKNVYNLSAMTREEAELTILGKGGDLCVRLFQRADGTVLTQDCPVGVRRKRLRLAGVLAIGSTLAGASAALFAQAADEVLSDDPEAIAAVVVEAPAVVAEEPVAPQVVTPPPQGRWLAGAPVYRPPPPHVVVVEPKKNDPKHSKEPKHVMGKLRGGNQL